jgi:hypothetical protein
MQEQRTCYISRTVRGYSDSKKSNDFFLLLFDVISTSIVLTEIRVITSKQIELATNKLVIEQSPYRHQLLRAK